MSTRSVSFLVLGGVLIAGLAACDNTGSRDAAAGPPVAAPSAAPTVSAKSTPLAATKKVEKKTGTKAGGEGGSAHCPVTATTLVAAIKNEHPDWGKQKLTHITCYQDYAISTRRSADPRADVEVETFRYAHGSWHTFTGGSGGYCVGVPENVTRYFRAHGREGCESSR